MLACWLAGKGNQVRPLVPGLGDTRELDAAPIAGRRARLFRAGIPGPVIYETTV